ncbi:MAG TPA: hypothetical protein DCQ92_03995 [Verrucomicrobia subdivision 3 bacterium]|nr:hypothetical protein [Limisphaerales bacterium]
MRISDIPVVKPDSRLAVFQKTSAMCVDDNCWEYFNEYRQAIKLADMQLTLCSGKLKFATSTARSKCNVHDFFGEITFCASLRQAPFAPIVHPKLNTGKEFPSACI